MAIINKKLQTGKTTLRCTAVNTKRLLHTLGDSSEFRIASSFPSSVQKHKHEAANYPLKTWQKGLKGHESPDTSASIHWASQGYTRCRSKSCCLGYCLSPPHGRVVNRRMSVRASSMWRKWQKWRWRWRWPGITHFGPGNLKSDHRCKFMDRVAALKTECGCLIHGRVLGNGRTHTILSPYAVYLYSYVYFYSARVHSKRCSIRWRRVYKGTK